MKLVAYKGAVMIVVTVLIGLGSIIIASIGLTIWERSGNISHGLNLVLFLTWFVCMVSIAIGLFTWYERQTSYEQYGMKREGEVYQIHRKERDDAFHVFKRADVSITPVFLSNPISVEWKVQEQTKDERGATLCISLMGYQLVEDSIEEMNRYLSCFSSPYPSNEKEIKKRIHKTVIPWVNTYYKTLITSHTYKELCVVVNSVKEEESPPVSFHVKWSVQIDTIEHKDVSQ